MLKFIKHLICFVIAIVLQTTLASWISFYGQEPDFVLIFLVVMALSHGPVSGMLWGFFAGFSEDVFASVDWLGAQTIAFTCVGFGVGQLEEKFLRLNLATKVALLGLAFMLNDLIYYALIGIAQESVTTFFLTKTLPECIYTMLFGILCFLLLNRLDRVNRRNA
ncbi:MAG: rod shape-determining protein MreD [Hallerella sp.]|jgi:rod shape-determining protein MreD|nr:rod shape-determining protein MreD [Fibrobacter sp.]MDY6370273.1 rod shape-determining protein MreD [Fibrobacter sp.]MDY6390210.1 rod shape-determining protein MreD [Fibrobacter sp.]MEE3340748.1 rod shape-determining protein MreD [Hallerella sp.]